MDSTRDLLCNGTMWSKPLLLLLAGVSVGPSGCGSPKTAHAAFVGWYIDSIDPAFYTVASEVTCDYYLSLRWEGDADLPDIEYARVYLPDQKRYWSFELDEEHFDAAKMKVFGYFTFSEDHNAVPIGNMKAAIKVKDGDVSTLDRTFTAPASTSTMGYDYAYSENGSALNSTYVPAIKRPTVTAHAIDYMAPQLSVTFVVSDSRVYDGYLWLYDGADTYIGYSSYFREGAGGAVSSSINSGATINTDGSPNMVVLGSPDVTLSSGYDFSNIAKVVLVVTDGTQYASAGRYNTHDYRAYSARVIL
jgi:hypothetical protein